MRRLAAIAARASVQVIRPVPYFPIVAPLPVWASTPDYETGGMQIVHAPMFYVPKFLKSLDGHWLCRSILPQLTKLKTAGQLDLVDAHFGYPEGVGAFMAARKLGVPFFVTLRGFEAEYIHKPLIGFQIRNLLRQADGCICVSHFLKELALENGAIAERTRVVHNAIDRELFYPGDRLEARHKAGLDADEPIVISVGHLITRKRHHILIAAFSELLRTYSNARLLIVGEEAFEPSYAQGLRNQISRLGIGDSVQLTGNVDAGRIGDYLRAADIFALATQREGCCNAVLEALACGLPVVTTPVGDNATFVEQGVNGYLVPVDDVAAMAAQLHEAIARRDWDRKRISEGLGVGDWDRTAAEVTEFFEAILEAS